MIYNFFQRGVNSTTCFSENTLPAHAHIVPFSTRKVCEEIDYFKSEELSDRVVFLGETWDFCYFANGLQQKPFDTDGANFGSIEVPCSWENAGFAPKKYSRGYDFPHSKMKVEDKKKSGNSLGVYRKSFDAYDLSKKYFLNFDKVNGAFEVYVNGTYCGFSALGGGEFDITKNVISGQNEVLVAVKKHTIASFVDGRDRISESGIVGNVYILVRNDLYLSDVDFRASLEEGKFSGKIALEFSVEKSGSACIISLEKDGKTLVSVKNDIANRVEHDFSGEFKPFLFETPDLYDLFITVEELGKVIECAHFKVGFGITEILNGLCCYNGNPLKLYGVNYNAVFNKRGEPMSFGDYEEDFRLLRDYGFNAICTKTYLPYSIKRLALVYGLYVIDAVPVMAAAEISAKPKHNFVANDTNFARIVFDKTMREYADCKLYCNVIGYYFEGASYNDKNFASVVNSLKDLGARAFIADAREDEVSVIVNPTVDGFVDEINKVSASRPVYMAEYAECYGIGNANLSEFAELVENTPCAVGGCASNFVDDNFDGVKLDYGMFTCDRKPYASAHSHRFFARPVKVRYIGEDKIEIFNNSYFDDTSYLDILVSVIKNGQPLSKVKLNVTVAPREARSVDVFIGHIDGDMYLNVECYERGSENLISLEQVSVHGDLVTLDFEPVGGKAMTVGEKFEVVEVRFDGGSVRFSKVTGTIIGYNINGKEILNPIASRKGGACFNTKINRPFSRNILNPKYFVADYTTTSFEIEHTEDSVKVNVAQEVRFGKKTAYTVHDSYTVKPSGTIEVHSTIVPEKKCPHAMDCFGKQLRFYPAFEHITYYGKGNVDNYIDLSDHSVMGIYETTASEMNSADLFGQECGNRTNVHYIMARDSENDGILVAAMENPMQVRVTTMSDGEIVEGYNNKSMPEKSGVYVDVNSVVSGYGSGNGAKPLAKYTLMSGEQNLDIKIYPLYSARETYGLQ